MPAKFRWDTSIHGWDKTTSGFGKQSAAILEFYFRFWIWRMHSHRCQGLQSRDHIKPALFELHWLPVHLRIEYKLCLLMHSVSVQSCPSYISDIVLTTAASSRRQGLRSSTDTLSYTVPPTVTKFGEQAFSVAGPSVWNSLPADIRHITDTTVFKRHLKTHFFNLYFNT